MTEEQVFQCSASVLCCLLCRNHYSHGGSKKQSKFEVWFKLCVVMIKAFGQTFLLKWPCGAFTNQPKCLKVKAWKWMAHDLSDSRSHRSQSSDSLKPTVNVFLMKRVSPMDQSRAASRAPLQDRVTSEWRLWHALMLHLFSFKPVWSCAAESVNISACSDVVRGRSNWPSTTQICNFKGPFQSIVRFDFCSLLKH